jgi:hypothetical protein
VPVVLINSSLAGGLVQGSLHSLILLASCLSAAILSLHAGQDDTFAKFYKEFRSSVEAGDKDKVASMIDFDNFRWDRDDNRGKIETKGSFLKYYYRLFSQTVKTNIAAVAPIKDESGDYQITWLAAGAQYDVRLVYSLSFRRAADGSYKLAGLKMAKHFLCYQ